MRYLVALAATLCLLLPQSDARAQKGDFCRGFEEGWKSLRGELAIVPICPVEPVTPVGSNSYREGIKSGSNAAKKSGGGNTGGASPSGSRNDQADFCRGFAEGWKTEKGDLSVVPVCPVAPVTPIGSTSYREGLKAGAQKGRAR